MTLNASYLPKEADMMETALKEGAINQFQDPGPFPSKIPLFIDSPRFQSSKKQKTL